MDSDSDEQFGSDEDAFDLLFPSFDEDSVASSDVDYDEIFKRDLRRVRNNDPDVKYLYGWGNFDTVQNITNEEWENIGRDISNNTYLEQLDFIDGALNDEKISSLFRGLTRSSSIVHLDLQNNDFSETGLMSLQPFLQNSINLRRLNINSAKIHTEGFNILWQALCGSPIERVYCMSCGITSIEIESVPNNNLRELDLSYNDIQSGGFNRLLRSLRESVIEDLGCVNCRIESIEIDTDSFPRNLKKLELDDNTINSNGCHEIAKLLQEGYTTFQRLNLDNNLIGDEGVAILVDALKTNTTLKHLSLEGNSCISRNGHILILKMLNDMSSIKATLQSNHTLQMIDLGYIHFDIFHGDDIDSRTGIDFHINMAITTNRHDPVAAGREKVIQTQLHSKRRAELASIQGVIGQSVYGEINPLHLPEVLSLVGLRHGQEELYVALKASIAEVISTVNRKLCLQQRRAYHAAMVEEIDTELAAMDLEEGVVGDKNETRGINRLRA